MKKHISTKIDWYFFTDPLLPIDNLLLFEMYFKLNKFFIFYSRFNIHLILFSTTYKKPITDKIFRLTH